MQFGLFPEIAKETYIYILSHRAHYKKPKKNPPNIPKDYGLGTHQSF